MRARARAYGARNLENLHIVLANFRAHAIQPACFAQRQLTGDEMAEVSRRGSSRCTKPRTQSLTDYEKMEQSRDARLSPS